MIAFYKGASPSYSIRGINYLRFTPSFIPISDESSVASNPDFADFDPKNMSQYKSGERILVRMPIDLIHQLAALPVLQRIKKYYPTCEIDLAINKEVGGLFDGFRQIDPTIRGDVSSAYYRQFNLMAHANEKDNGPTHQAMFTISQKMLFWAGLYDHRLNDREMKSIHFSVPHTEAYNKNYMLVLTNGDNPALTFKDFGAYLKDKTVIGNYPLKISDAVKIEKNFYEQLNLINNAKLVIACGHSDLAYLACVLGVPLLIFFPAGGDPQKFIKQYSAYPNVNLAKIDDDPTMFEKIIDGIKKNIDQWINWKDTPTLITPKPSVSLPSDSSGVIRLSTDEYADFGSKYPEAVSPLSPFSTLMDNFVNFNVADINQIKDSLGKSAYKDLMKYTVR